MVLTDERLAEIVVGIGPMGHGCGMCLTFDDCPAQYQPGCDDCVLLSREGAAMLAELIEARASLRKIANRQRDFAPDFDCTLCNGHYDSLADDFYHDDDCPVGVAKEYIESHNLPY